MNSNTGRNFYIDKIITTIDKIQSIQSDEPIEQYQREVFLIEPKIEKIMDLRILKEINEVLETSLMYFEYAAILEAALEHISNLVNEQQLYNDEQLINSKAIFDFRKEFYLTQIKYSKVLIKKRRVEDRAKNMSKMDPQYFMLKSDYDDIERELNACSKIFKVIYQKIQNSNITRDIIKQSISTDRIKQIKDLTDVDAKVMKDRLMSDYESFEKENKRFVALDQDYGKLFDEIIDQNEIAQIFNHSKNEDQAFQAYLKFNNNALLDAINTLNQKVTALEDKVSVNALPDNLLGVYEKINQAIQVAFEAYQNKATVDRVIIDKANKVDQIVESNDLNQIINHCINEFNPPAIDVAYFKIRKYIELFFKHKHNMDFFAEPYVNMFPKKRFEIVFNASDASALSNVWRRCNDYIHGTMDYFQKITSNGDNMINGLKRDFDTIKKIGAYLTAEEIDMHLKDKSNVSTVTVTDIKAPIEKSLDTLVGKLIEGTIIKVTIKNDGENSYKYGFIQVGTMDQSVYFKESDANFEPVINNKVRFLLKSRIDEDKTNYFAKQVTQIK